MGEAIGQSLASAVGVALSPLPVIAVILMLTTPRARINGPAFVAGWLAGLAVIGTLVLTLAGPPANEDGAPATWTGWVKLLLGALLLVIAARQFQGRPHGGAEPAVPGWLRAIDGFSGPKALGAGAVLSAANPKNLLLAVAGATTIAQSGIGGGQQAGAYAIFALVGTLGVLTPVVLYFALGDRSARLLGSLKDWLGLHQAVIMSVLCLVIGAKLIGDGISVLW
jgi:Sap-like sulfolipid-1-addressing protein